MNYEFRKAKVTDATQLLGLYAEVYGPTYPIAFGTDRKVMVPKIKNNRDLWLVAVDLDEHSVVGSVVFDIDEINKIGKVEGLVVSPLHRSQNLASKLVEMGTKEILGKGNAVNSLYATTRTNSISVQRIFLRDKFLPLGIFPNAHRLQDYETLTLFAKYREGVLERRAKVASVPSELKGILDVIANTNKILTPTEYVDPPELTPPPKDHPLDFELVYAPHFVLRRFDEKMKDPYDRFFPFHIPNLLMTSIEGSVEIYAYYNKQDHYCAIVSLNVPVYTLAGRLGKLLDQLKGIGVSYLELLLGLEFTESIQTALQAGLVPSAFYPAMRETENGETHDFVVLSHSLEPLDFRKMAVDRSFKHFIDQYVRQWTKKHLLSLEVIDAR